MSDTLLPITVRMYREARAQVQRREPGRTQYIPVAYFPAQHELTADRLGAVDPMGVHALVVTTQWASVFRSSMQRDWTTGEDRPFPWFIGWRCLNPIVAEEYMPA